MHDLLITSFDPTTVLVIAIAAAMAGVVIGIVIVRHLGWFALLNLGKPSILFNRESKLEVSVPFTKNSSVLLTVYSPLIVLISTQVAIVYLSPANSISLIISGFLLGWAIAELFLHFRRNVRTTEYTTCRRCGCSPPFSSPVPPVMVKPPEDDKRSL